MKTEFRADQLAAFYGKNQVLFDLSIPTLLGGSVTSLVGPNGAGKSSLLRVLAGLIPAKGRALLSGENILAWGIEQRARKIGFMPQSFAVNLRLTVLDAVITAIKVSHIELTAHSCRIQAADILEKLAISDLAFTYMAELSGGQKQMVSLAQSLVSNPQILLLDEPISALDLRHQFHVMRSIREIAQEGRIVIMVLHDLEMAARWSDNLAVMRKGALYAYGTPEAVISKKMLRDVYEVHADVSLQEEGTINIAVNGIVEKLHLKN